MDFVFSQPIQRGARLFEILRVIKQRQRNVPPGRGVLPVTVAGFLEQYRAQQTLRRDCVDLWRAGVLERVGGSGSRRGYRVAA